MRSICVWASLLSIASPLVAQDGDAALRQEIEQLRQEMRSMQQAYEQRLQTLEQRLANERGGREQKITPAEARATETQVEIERTVTKPPPEPRRLLDSFEYHGYLRSGFGVNTRAGDQEIFQAPGALAKYRLGNENDTYLEQMLSFYHNRDKPDAPQFATHVRGSYATGQDVQYDPENQVVLREAYVEAKDIFRELPGASAWGGLRFYRRQDIHINDFYFLDMSGYGAGMENIPLGKAAKLHVAYIGYADDAVLTDIGRLTKQNLDIRLTDIESLRHPQWGELRFWLNPSYIPSGTDDTTGEDYDSNFGLAFGVMHVLEWPDEKSFNKLSIQYGFGASSTFQSGGFVPPTGGADDASRLLITEQLVIQPSESFSLQLAAIYQDLQNPPGVEGTQRWVSLGARPFFHFTRNYGLQLEGGWDYVSNDDGPDGSLFKFTVAPTLTIDNTFFGRPQIRIFYTHAFWSSGLEGFVGGPTYEDSTNGGTFGVQVESWW